MLVYFDESYASKERLMLGALFVPSYNAKKALHRGLKEIKELKKFTDTKRHLKEIKYNNLTTKTKFEIAKAAADLFFSRGDCFFRACVVPYDEEQLDKVGRQQGVPRKLKEAMLYTNSFIKLIQNNIPDVRNAVLMMDQLTKANGDRFDSMIRERLGTGKNAIFRHMGYVDSSSERNHTIQICDLLLGAILNEHHPTQVKFKNDFREHVKGAVGVASLKEDYWGNQSHSKMCSVHPKYTIRYWGVPYKYLKV